MRSVRCRTAVIALAGFGTHRLPITKAIEKSMLPVGNRPIIDYIVDDCVAAGIEEIIFVVGEQSSQLRTYYGSNSALEEYLQAKNADTQLQEISSLKSKARYSFVTQPIDAPYGTSTPLWLAKDLLPDNKPFLYLYGDNIFYTDDKKSTITQFVDRAADIAASHAMMVVEVPETETHKYGIVATRQSGGVPVLDYIVEKPAAGQAPSNLNNAGCFLLTSHIYPELQRSIEHSPQDEKYLTDAVSWFAGKGNDVAVITASGEFLDCGTVDGWLYANNRILGK